MEGIIKRETEGKKEKMAAKGRSHCAAPSPSDDTGDKKHSDTSQHGRSTFSQHTPWKNFVGNGM